MLRADLHAGVAGGTAERDLNSTAIPDQDYTRLAAKQSVSVRYTDASSQVTILEGDDLRQVDVAWLNRYEPGWRLSSVASSQAQLPSRFYLRPDGGSLFLGLTPIPSTGSSASIAVLVPYVARPATLTSSTDVPFTAGGATRSDLRPYHQAAVHYAAYQLEKLRRDMDASQGQLKMFMTYVARYTQSLRQKGGTALTFTRQYFRRSLGRRRSDSLRLTASPLTSQPRPRRPAAPPVERRACSAFTPPRRAFVALSPARVPWRTPDDWTEFRPAS
jgi:hypothetical protein